MSKLKIIKIPNKILNTISKEIQIIDRSIKKLSEDMLEAMYRENGIGLAAPQIAKNIRMVVIDLQEDEKFNPFVFINPEIVKRSSEKITFTEGCLSVPDKKVDILRNKEIKLKYFDLRGKEQELYANDLFSVCIQHEIDHLNGITIQDKLEELNKNNF